MCMSYFLYETHHQSCALSPSALRREGNKSAEQQLWPSISHPLSTEDKWIRLRTKILMLGLTHDAQPERRESPLDSSFPTREQRKVSFLSVGSSSEMHSLWERRKECEREWIGQGARIFCMAEKEFCRSAYNTNIFLVRAMDYFSHCRRLTPFWSR